MYIMDMKALLSELTGKFFGERLDFRAKIFNATMFIVLVAWTTGGAVGIMSARGESIAGIPALLCVALGAVLVWYANKSGNYQRCYWIMTIVIFMIQVPIGFFLNGGYKNSGMLAGFMTSVIITAFLFEGKKAIIVPFILIVQYSALFIYTYYYPDSVIKYYDEHEQFIFNISGFVSNCIWVCVIVILYLRFHDRQKRELDKARQLAVAYEKQSHALVTEMSHELRTPLAVMSNYALYAVEQIKTKGVTNETLNNLGAISEEARRLAKMADETLAILRSSSAIEHGGDRQKTLVDTAALVNKIITLQKPVTERIGLDLQTEINDNLPPLTGDAGELAQIIWNIIQNAIIHSSADTLTVSAKANGNAVAIIVEDDGDGIEPDILRNIFERGARKERVGLGLPISRDIARRHGGDISVESRLNKGTRVVVSLPSSSVNKENNNEE